MDDEVKRLFFWAFELIREHQREINNLHGSVRGLYEFARERDPESALDLGMKSSEYKRHEASGHSAETLRRLDELLRELKE